MVARAVLIDVRWRRCGPGADAGSAYNLRALGTGDRGRG